jgi:hypothetical protein
MIFYIIPSFMVGGDEESRFVAADGAIEAMRLASIDIDGMEPVEPRCFEPVAKAAQRSPELHWRCYEIPSNAAKGVIAWDAMNPTYWDDGER